MRKILVSNQVRHKLTCTFTCTEPCKKLKKIGSGNSTEEGVGVKHAYDLKLTQCRWPDREIKMSGFQQG